MTIATHHAAPEEIMAWLDGELAAAEAHPIAEHVQACAECAALAEQFRETSHALAAWTVESVPEAIETRIREQSARSLAHHAAKIPAPMRVGGARWPRWAIGWGCVITVLLLFGIFHSQPRYMLSPRMSMRTENTEVGGYAALQQPARPPKPAQTSEYFYNDLQAPAQRKGTAGMVNGPLTNQTAPSPSAPMIARTVSLTIQVKDVAGSRQALDAILSRYQGYAAELTINTPEGSARSFSASLRIPAPALSAALADLRSLGRVQNESQSGEEVTQQHADLVARLKNARETEQRLLAILEKRTGKVEEVLQVEEQISNTRGEIERMEAEQKALEHRVDFATVQLQLAEEYKAQLNGPSTSIGTRMHNAIVNGLGNAGSSLLGILLFFEEFGPVLLVWLVVLGTPAWLLWRRFRNAQSRI
jgi:hypothetical protein